MGKEEIHRVTGFSHLPEVCVVSPSPPDSWFHAAPSLVPEVLSCQSRHSRVYLFLPEKEELDKLLRYEAMINRQLNHAMGELERVQTRRKVVANPTRI